MTGIAIIQCALHQRLAITTPRGANTDPSGPRLISTTAFPQAFRRWRTDAAGLTSIDGSRPKADICERQLSGY
jgi:hypothetical protein